MDVENSCIADLWTKILPIIYTAKYNICPPKDLRSSFCLRSSFEKVSAYFYKLLSTNKGSQFANSITISLCINFA